MDCAGTLMTPRTGNRRVLGQSSFSARLSHRRMVSPLTPSLQFETRQLRSGPSTSVSPSPDHDSPCSYSPPPPPQSPDTSSPSPSSPQPSPAATQASSSATPPPASPPA